MTCSVDAAEFKKNEEPGIENFPSFFDQSVTHARLGPTKVRSRGLPRCTLFALPDGSQFGAQKQWVGRTDRFYPLAGDVFGHAGAVNILGRKMPRSGARCTRKCVKMLNWVDHGAWQIAHH